MPLKTKYGRATALLGVNVYPRYFLLTGGFAAIVIRDVNERGRDIQGIVKQWLTFVKPNFVKVRIREPCNGTSPCTSFMVVC